MPVCQSCGQENPEVARFCLACGNPLSEATPPGVERRVVTVIFVDLVGFTARAERLDPEEVQAVLSPYHDRVRREIESFGGVVEKFIGDAVMGLFGATVAHGDDAERAVRAALVVRDGVDELAGGGLQIRIAVNTGEAVVSLGARPTLGESMVAGDVVNTAARLQAAAPVNGIVVGEETYRETRGTIEYEVAEPVVAKGKEHPVEAWIAVRALTEAGERPLSGSTIVGRESELAILHTFWERASTEQQPHLVSIFGSAGVGKSTVAAEFARIATESGARAVRGRSLPYRESGTYGSLASQLMQLCNVFESDSAQVVADKLRGRTAELLASSDADPELVAGHLGVIVGIDAGNEASDREALFSSTRQFLEGAAREQPTVLVFEDIHWADANMLDLIEALAARVRGLPLLFLTLSRPELHDRREGWASGISAYTALTLAPLGEQHARELAVRRLGDTDRVDEVIRLAEGNPLFIEQLAATIDETATGSLPTSVRALVAARLDALPRAERALLIDASVVGKVFWEGALRAMSPENADHAQLLEDLERRDLVRREATSMIEGQPQFAFTHVLIRDVAYDLLPRADRARRHELVAEFFESSTGSSGEAIGALARHWRDAGDHERAVEQLVRAAEQAERGWAKDHAAQLYREALELVAADDTERKSALRRRLAVAAQASYHLPDVRR
ncbi:MAG TPA: AAA family ATPase [Gaiellaceae bacterium]|nr:AAA family ATPase [Gaiellaceae bacterium]